MATGYDNDFAESIEDFECPLCLHVTRDPTLTSCCGQHFCQTCINIVFTDHNPCPCCNEPRFNVFLDKKQNRRVLELMVNCAMKEQGCQWIGELGKLEAHLDYNSGTCEYIDVTCPNQCGEIMPKIELNDHLKKHCPKRDCNCLYCDHKFSCEFIMEHVKTCPKYPVFCPNQCGAKPIERKNLKEHIKECPCQLVDCEYTQIGCKEKLQRQQIAKHLEQSVQTHLSLVSQHSLKLTQQLLDKQRKIEKDQQLLNERVSLIEVSSMLPPVELKLYRYCANKERVLVLYTHPQGHKLQFKFTGYYSSSSSLYAFETNVSHVKGEHDNPLESQSTWSIEITIFDQAEGKADHVEKKEMTLPSPGGNTFKFKVPLGEKLKRTKYVSNNAIHMKLDIKKIH